LKHLRPIIALLSLSALAGGTVQAEQAKAVDTEALRVDYQAVEQYSFSANCAGTEYVLRLNGSGVAGNLPANRFCLPPLTQDALPLSLADRSDALPLYLLYGVLLFYDRFTGFA